MVSPGFAASKACRTVAKGCASVPAAVSLPVVATYHSAAFTGSAHASSASTAASNVILISSAPCFLFPASYSPLQRNAFSTVSLASPSLSQYTTSISRRLSKDLQARSNSSSFMPKVMFTPAS